MNKAFIFPGQGSQHVGMGKELYKNFDVAKNIFDSVDDELNFKLSKIIFEGPEEELNKTENTQPALMTASIAALNVMLNESGKNFENICSVTAGHSLGQYTAMVASGCFDYRVAAKILKFRGKFMQDACSLGQGAMAAVLGAEKYIVDEVLQNSVTNDEICQIANHNSSNQIVISGHVRAVEKSIAEFKALGIKAIKLNVSAPFHSKLMDPAKEKMKEILDQVQIKNAKIDIIDNVSIAFTKDGNFLKERLLEQIPGTIRWKETMDLLSDKIDIAIEVGPGKVLTNMIKRSSNIPKAQNLFTIDEIKNYIDEYSVL